MRFKMGETVFVKVNPTRLHAKVGTVVEQFPPSICVIESDDGLQSYNEDWLYPFYVIEETP